MVDGRYHLVISQLADVWGAACAHRREPAELDAPISRFLDARQKVTMRISEGRHEVLFDAAMLLALVGNQLEWWGQDLEDAGTWLQERAGRMARRHWPEETR